MPTAAELLYGQAAVWEAWDPGLHPRGPGGKFAHVEDAIHHAVAHLAPEPGGYVRLADLRRHIGSHHSRSEVDNSLRMLNRKPGIVLTPESNQKILTAADRAAAVHFGGEDRHYISIQGVGGGRGGPAVEAPHATSVPKPAAAKPAKLPSAPRKPSTSVERDLKGLRRRGLEQYAAEHGVNISPLDTDAAIRRKILDAL